VTPTERRTRRKVFIHVGSPKTGTTYLQNILWAGRRTAADQGLLLPMENFGDHYLASLDVRGIADRPQFPPRAQGMWKRVVEAVEAWQGNALVSHELFAAAPKGQAERAVSSFGPDTEVHVVLTARDLLRQLPAEWQEHVKHRSTLTLDAFVRRAMNDDRGKMWFWRVQDYAGVLHRWGDTLPREHVHVVTVPPRGADPTALWTRFASLLDLDPDAFRLDVGRDNTSLGLEQAELLRRVNQELGDRMGEPGRYPRIVKEIFAQELLAAHKGSPLQVDEEAQSFAVTRSREITDRLREMGVDVVGDLAELVPDPSVLPPPGGYQEPEVDAVLAEAVAALADVLERMARFGGDEREYRRQLQLMHEMPVRYALLQASKRHPSLARARELVLRAVRRRTPTTPA
jgi:hypothetical protein